MSRTDDLRSSGGSERGGNSGGGAPFVKWGDGYSWLEGRIKGTFTTKFGLAATFDVQAVSDNGLDTQGRDEDGNQYQGHVVSGEEVNVGLNSATLEDKITVDDKGKSFHVAFEGWEEPPNGNRYRLFAVVELHDRPQRSAEGIERMPPTDDGEPEPVDTTDYDGVS